MGRSCLAANASALRRHCSASLSDSSTEFDKAIIQGVQCNLEFY